MRGTRSLDAVPPLQSLWANNGFGDEGDEIFFVNEAVLHRVAFETEPVVRLGAPEPLFKLPASTELLDYDGSSRFLCLRRRSGKSRVYVDTGWAK